MTPFMSKLKKTTTEQFLCNHTQTSSVTKITGEGISLIPMLEYKYKPLCTVALSATPQKIFCFKFFLVDKGNNSGFVLSLKIFHATIPVFLWVYFYQDSYI